MTPVHRSSQVTFVDIVDQVFHAQAEQGKPRWFEYALKIIQELKMLLARNMYDGVVGADRVERFLRKI